VIVDTHVHPLADDFTHYPLSPGERDGPDWYTGIQLTAEDCIREMDSAGVNAMVLVSSYSAYGNDNSYAADCAARFPDRFVGVCRIDGNAPDAPETLRYWVEERGMRGVRLGAATPDVEPTCDRARQLGIPVAIQVPRRELGDVRRIAERFPDLDIVLDHLAHPTVADGSPSNEAGDLFALAACPNVVFKFSTLNIREPREDGSSPQALLESLLRQAGPGRIIWGSDHPHSMGTAAAPYKDLVDLARTTLSFLSPTQQEQIFSVTALRLYPALTRR
jgi:predicted TIM-barrel fold metal-dependent hydrolase